MVSRRGLNLLIESEVDNALLQKMVGDLFGWQTLLQIKPGFPDHPFEVLISFHKQRVAAQADKPVAMRRCVIT